MIGARRPISKQIAELLDQQHGALLKGDLDVLVSFAPRLEKAFDALRRSRAAAEDVAPLMLAAARNARLIQSAQAGVAQAHAHLRSRRSADFTTYDASGRSHAVTPHPSRDLSRR